MKNQCNKSNSIISSKGKPNKAKIHTNVTELTNQQPNKKCTPSKKQTKAVVKADIKRDTESSIESNGAKCTKRNTQQKQQQQAPNWYRTSCHSNEPKIGQDNKNSKSTTGVKIQSNLFTPKPFTNNYSAIKKDVGNRKISSDETNAENSQQQALQLDALGAVCMKSTKNQAEVVSPCSKCSSYSDTVYSMLSSPSQMQRIAQTDASSYRGNNKYHRYSFDRNYAERRKELFSSLVPAKPDCSGTNILCALADVHRLTLIQRIGNVRKSFPLMQCGTLEEDTLDSTYHHDRSKRMDVFQIDDGFHSDGGTETPPLSSSSGSSIASTTSDHGSMDNVDTGGAQRLAVLSFEQVRKLNDVMDDVVYIHGRGNFPTLEVKLKDLVNLVRRKLETDIGSGGAGVIVKDVRLNGGAASHVLASEDQPYNDLDLIYAIELTSSRHFDRVKNAVLNTLMDLLPDATSKHRIMPCALKEAYVGKMVKVNNNNDGDRWSLISLGSKRGHKNVELKFVDTMRRQFEFSVDSFQIILDSLLLFYDCAALPISDNFYPTVVGESVYGDFQEAMYHLQKKLISTRQPEEIRGGGLLKYCNLLVRNYVPIDPQQMKTQERYMCSRFFIDFPDIATQTLKLDGYLADHFCGVDEEPLQYQYLMHLRDVVEMSTVCLMGHERRQTLLLIQYLAAQVLYKEHQRQQTQVMVHYEQQQQQQQHHPQQQPQSQQPQQQQQQQVVMDMESQQMYVSHHQTTQQQQQQNMDMQQQPQPMYIQQQQQQQQRTVKILEQIQQQQQMLLNTTLSSPPPQTIQIPSGPLGLIYANGVYYAPVIPATICTCNSTWVST